MENFNIVPPLGGKIEEKKELKKKEETEERKNKNDT